MSDADTVSRLLAELEDGRPGSFDDLFAAVYHELRAIARNARRGGPSRETLGTTALVHEAYLKLATSDAASRRWESKAHFMAAIAKAIRHVLINYARDQRTQKRGGGWRRASIETDQLVANSGATGYSDELLTLDDALVRLEGHSARLSRIVECRCYGGLTIEETATALAVSTATVTRGWATAQAWLYRELAGDGKTS